MNNPIFFTIGLGQWHLIRKSEVDENLDENQKSFSALGGNRFLPEKWGVVRVFNHPKSRSKRLVQSECSEVCEKWEWCEWCEWCEWDSQTSSMVKLPSRGLNMGPGTGTDQGLDAPVTCHDSTINGGWFYGQIGDGWWLKQLKPEKEHFFPRTGRNFGELVAVSPKKPWFSAVNQWISTQETRKCLASPWFRAPAKPISTRAEARPTSPSTSPCWDKRCTFQTASVNGPKTPESHRAFLGKI